MNNAKGDGVFPQEGETALLPLMGTVAPLVVCGGYLQQSSELKSHFSFWQASS